MIFSYDCVCWKWRCVVQFFMKLSISALMLGQYTDSQASSFVFSMPMWFMWSCSKICCLRLVGMIICLPFSITPSFTASSSLYDQYSFRSACSSSLVLSHSAMIRFFSFWRWSSCMDACCISATDTHSSMSVELCMASTQTSMSFIGLSLPYTWLCLDS